MLRIGAALTTMMFLANCPAAGQSGTSTAARPDAADSATTARAEFRAAREALVRADTAEALKKLRVSADAWPQQPAYSDALLDLALRAGDNKAAEHALGLARRIGVALTSSESTFMTSARGTDALTPFINEQKEWRAPIERSRTFRTLSDSSLFPEALGFDPRTGTLYVSSIQQRNVLAVMPDGHTYPLMRDSRKDVGGIFGIVVDTARNVLWAASAPTPEMSAKRDSTSTVAALLAIRLSDGKIIRRLAIPASAANASPGDIALSPNGDVLVADAQAGVLWWLRGNADTLIAIRHHLFRSLQGVVPAADGNVAWVADYSHGILRVELNAGRVERVADLPGHTTVGLDGMVRRGDSFVAVQNGFAPAQVLQIALNANGTRITAQTVIDRSTHATSPTGGVMIGNQFVYIANSLWDVIDASGAFPKGVVLPRPLLLSVPLKH